MTKEDLYEDMYTRLIDSTEKISDNCFLIKNMNMEVKFKDNGDDRIKAFISNYVIDKYRLNTVSRRWK